MHFQIQTPLHYIWISQFMWVPHSIYHCWYLVCRNDSFPDVAFLELKNSFVAEIYGLWISFTWINLNQIINKSISMNGNTMETCHLRYILYVLSFNKTIILCCEKYQVIIMHCPKTSVNLFVWKAGICVVALSFANRFILHFSYYRFWSALWLNIFLLHSAMYHSTYKHETYSVLKWGPD